jgi:hypothetical protein
VPAAVKCDKMRRMDRCRRLPAPLVSVLAAASLACAAAPWSGCGAKARTPAAYFPAGAEICEGAPHAVVVNLPYGSEKVKVIESKKEQGLFAIAGACGQEKESSILDTVAGALKSEKACKRIARKDPGLTGKIVIGLRIGPGGGTSAVEILGDDTGNARLAKCILDLFETMVFPSGLAGEGTVSATLPVLFSTEP